MQSHTGNLSALVWFSNLKFLNADAMLILETSNSPHEPQNRLPRHRIMPELPEVETVRRGLAPALEGRILARVNAKRADLRIAFPQNFAGRLTGRRVSSVSRRAKYLLVHLDNGETLIVHLGMSGRLTIHGIHAAA